MSTLTDVWPSIDVVQSADTDVAKYVFKKDTAVAESVLYKYGTYEQRTVICCSTQSGCPVGCRFCGAGDYFVRSLTTDEIVAQSVHLIESNNIDPKNVERMQIMFMSMGEPMLNWNHLEPAIVELHRLYPKAALLLSTSGPDVDYEPMLVLASLIPTLGLQFSVHESTDEARDALIPFKKKLDLEGIARIGEQFFWRTTRQPFFNYCVHENNNADVNVDQLNAYFNPMIWQSTISVICERDESVAAANDRQRYLATEFMVKMMKRGYSTRTFDPAGQDDIGGGCGQLWFVQDWMRQNPDKARPSIGNGLPTVHTPLPVANPMAVKGCHSQVLQ